MPDRYFGKYTGIVVDNRDTLQLGQLQVAVPAIFAPDERVTARAALPYGFFFVPEVGGKVWVEFEGGDTGLPLWTGVQYVAGEWPAEAQADPPDRRVIKSAAGHLLTLDDTPGGAQLELRDASGHSVTLKTEGITIKTTDGATVELTPAGVKVDAGAAIVHLTGSQVRLGPGALPVIRLGDSGIGNLGAPVVMTVSSNSQVLA
jgi:hypothetical protein